MVWIHTTNSPTTFPVVSSNPKFEVYLQYPVVADHLGLKPGKAGLGVGVSS